MWCCHDPIAQIVLRSSACATILTSLDPISIAIPSGMSRKGTYDPRRFASSPVVSGGVDWMVNSAFKVGMIVVAVEAPYAKSKARNNIAMGSKFD